MRGSPILRTLLLAVLMLLAGGIFVHFQRPREILPMAVPREISPQPKPAARVIGYEIALSAPAQSVKLVDQNGVELVTLKDVKSGDLGGFVASAGKLQSLTIFVTWAEPVPAHGFVRVSLEPPRAAMLENVFDGSGKILQGVWTLP